MKIRPILDFYLKIPLLEIGTAVYRDTPDTYIREYLMLWVKLYKWSFKFRLYNTMVQVISLKIYEEEIKPKGKTK